MSTEIWTSKANFNLHSMTFENINNSLQGLNPPFDPIKDAEVKRQAAEEQRVRAEAEIEANRLQRTGAEDCGK